MKLRINCKIKLDIQIKQYYNKERRQKMKKFTYLDYLKYTKINNEIMMLQEKSAEYKLEKIHQYKDKAYKIMLEDKEEVVQLINKVLGLKEMQNEIQKEEIEKYKNEYITKEFKSTRADIIYKKKGGNIFFKYIK